MKYLSTPETVRFARHRGTWLVPVVFILMLAIVFPAIYLSATSDPQGSLRDFPVAIVIEPQTIDGAYSPASAVAAAIGRTVDPKAIDLTNLTADELAQRMSSDDIAGAVVIPASFDRDIQAMVAGKGSALKVPTVKILTNAGDGGISSGLVTGNLNPVLAGVRNGLGSTLLQERARLGAPASGADQVLLASPFQVTSQPYAALPANAGFGTSAFYYTLVLMLLGFVGASVVGPTVDSALGFAPTEVGPVVVRKPYLHLTRLQTFLLKGSVLTAASPAAAGITQLVACGVGIPISQPWILWAFASAAIAAVGWGALAVFAVFGGGIGSLINTLFFVALSMTSSGGTVPVAATPPFFHWLSSMTPFHGVLEGVRALFYFDGNTDAGLADGWTHIAAGAGISLLIGFLATKLYARHPRHPETEALTRAPATALEMPRRQRRSIDDVSAKWPRTPSGPREEVSRR